MKEYKTLLFALSLMAIGLTTAIIILLFQSNLFSGMPITTEQPPEQEFPLPAPYQPPGSPETGTQPAVINLGSCSIDVEGPNDLPEQQDITRFCQGQGPLSLFASWSWDAVFGDGNNTLDACALFDNNGDGDINYSLCVRVIPDQQDNYRLVYHSTILYSCGDDKPDRCTNPDVRALSPGTSCTTGQQSNDPFDANVPNGPGDDFPDDTVAACSIDENDVGGFGTVLVNACSYPSGEPNSDPMDCVAFPASGFLTVQIEAIPNDQTVGSSFIISDTQGMRYTPLIFGSGASERYSLPSNQSYSVLEIVPPGWQLNSASCTDQYNQQVGTGFNPITDIHVSPGSELRCYFINGQPPTATPTETATPTATATTTLTPTPTLTPDPNLRATPTREHPGGSGNSSLLGISVLFGLLLLIVPIIFVLVFFRRRREH